MGVRGELFGLRHPQGVAPAAARGLRGGPLQGGAADAGMGIEGAVRGKKLRTTRADNSAPCPLDRVNRQFRTPRPNALWLSDFTYVSTWAGFVYVAFVLDALEQALTAGRSADLEPLSPTRRKGEQTLLTNGPDQGAGSKFKSLGTPTQLSISRDPIRHRERVTSNREKENFPGNVSV